MATIKLGNTKVASKLINYAEKRAIEREGLNCNPEYAKNQFTTTRNLYSKTNGIQAHHIIQSFKPGEVNSSEANKAGMDLVSKLTKGHECLVYTHADKEHIHNHIIINSVNYENGKKFQLHGKKAIDKVRRLSDEICKNRGLSIVKELSAKIRYTQAEQSILERGQTSWKDCIREAVDYEKANSKTYDDFKKNLLENHRVEVNDKKKHITYKLEGQKQVARGKTLGMDYERGAIEYGFERQNTRETSKERGATERTKLERNRELIEGNERTQQANAELHKSAIERGHIEENNSRKRTGQCENYESRDTKENDINIANAREHAEKLRKESCSSYGKWKERDEQEQQSSIKSNESDRENIKDQHRGNGEEITKQLERNRAWNFDLSR